MNFIWWLSFSASRQKCGVNAIFNNETLQQMANQMPACLEDMGQIPGVPLAKLNKFGAEFLEITQKFNAILLSKIVVTFKVKMYCI